jgi:hypothetical protein
VPRLRSITRLPQPAKAQAILLSVKRRVERPAFFICETIRPAVLDQQHSRRVIMRFSDVLAPALTAVVATAICASSASAARDDGPQTTRSFPVGSFRSVELAGSDDVHVVRGNRQGVTASGPSGVLDRLDIRVENGALKINRRRSGWTMSWGSSRGAVVTVTTPGIEAAALAGSGNMRIDQISGGAFKGSVAGSGKLILPSVRVGTVALNLAGSGNINAAGAVRSARLSVGGSGDLIAPGLVSQTADVSVNGSGSAQVVARGRASLSLAGSGDIMVRGTTNCAISKAGSGDARCIP